MSTYREIHGKAVKSLSTDPSAETDAGQIWYNTASDTFKSIINSEAWASSGNLITGQRNGAGFGTQTALVFAAGIGPAGPAIATTQEYNGSGWSNATNYPTSTYNLSGFGTLTAGAAVGGYPSENATKEYDGTNWTAGGNYPTGIHSLSTHGTQTAAIAAGGSPAVTTSATYNGTAWTATPGSLNTGRGMGGMAGTTTAAVLMGGGTGPDPGVSNATEECDGSTWTSVTNTPTNIENQGATGEQTAAIYFGGRTPSVVAAAFKYDGTSYSAAPSMGTARYALARGTLGTQTAAIGAGGYASGTKDLTEEFNSSVNAITAAAWSAAPSLNTSRAAVGRSGIAPTQNAALCVSGYPGPPSTIDVKNVEEFDGSSWTEVGDVNSQRYNGMCAGTTTAGLFFGGNSDVTPGTKPLPLSEEWDGSSWTAGNTMQNGNEAAGGFGTQTAAVQAGGSLNPYPNYTNTTEEYNGTSWSNVPATIFASVAGVTGVGTETAGLIFCGTEAPPPGTNYSTAQTYNGTAFTTVNACVETGNKLVGGGTQTAAFGAGGGPGNKSRVQHYDGTTWSTAAALGTGRGNSSGGAPQAAGIYYAGNPGSGSTGATEQFTAETTAVNVKTLTQS